MINIHDNTVPFHVMEHIFEFVMNSNFHVKGWKDRDHINKHDIHSRWTIDDLKAAKLYPYLEAIPSGDFSKWYKTTVTLTHAGDHYYTHAHGANDNVLLYYANLEWRDEWHGETLFYDHNRVSTNAYQYTPGRILEFDGSLPHSIRPQSFIGPQYRFTVSTFFGKK